MRSSFIVMALILMTTASAQEINQEVVLPDGKQFLLGEISLEKLTTESYGRWFNQNYENYQVDESLVGLFKNRLSKCEIKLFLGTWCGDSKREVPKFVKILHAADYPLENVTLVALDRRKEHYKKSPGGEEVGWNIQRVPTFIFLKQGKEINRIVESPIDSMEEDVLAILSGSEYIPNYSN